MKPIVTTAVLGLTLAFAGCNRPPEKKVIALVTKAMDSEFWLVLADGAKSAAAEHPDYELVIAAPDREINVDQQVSILENQIRRGVKVLLVDPAGTAQVNSTLEQAVDRGIPVILIDTDAPFAKKSSYIGTDNAKGGSLAAKGMVDAIGSAGEVALISGVPGNESQDARAKGFLDEIAKTPGIKIVAQQPGNSERQLGLTVMENMLTAHPNIKGVFATNDQMALGAMEAVEARKLRGKIAIIGFDATKEAANAIIEGKLTGSVAQSPRDMGRQGVLSAIALAEGRTIAKLIDTGTAYVDAKNAAQYAK
ncbi:MAG: sugar ABC transporter substrate-binding protein [Vicinamibacteria bacterium]